MLPWEFPYSSSPQARTGNSLCLNQKLNLKRPLTFLLEIWGVLCVLSVFCAVNAAASKRRLGKGLTGQGVRGLHGQEVG